jgi:hypothetical protein
MKMEGTASANIYSTFVREKHIIFEQDAFFNECQRRKISCPVVALRVREAGKMSKLTEQSLSKLC